MIEPYDDAAPTGDDLTAYDQAHLKLYARLLDADSDGADWREFVRIVFGIEPAREPRRAATVHQGHLARARWMARKGYLLLLRGSPD